MTTFITAGPPSAREQCHWRPPQGRPIRGPASQQPTNFLPFQNGRNIINGVAFAHWSKTPLTVHLTAHMDMCGRYDPDDPIGSQGRLINACTDWLNDRGIPVRYAWVREWGHRKGAHWHGLLHLPAQHWADFCGFFRRAGDFHSIPGRFDVPFKMSGGQFGMMVPSMQAGALRYVLKSMSPQARLAGIPIMKALDLRHRPSLPLQGKRSGTSHSLSISARKAVGWRELTTLPELRSVLHPKCQSNPSLQP